MTPRAYQYKLALDGLDFSQSQLGQACLNDLMVSQVQNVGLIDVSGLQSFIDSCVIERRKAEPTHPLPLAWRDKYQVGLFSLSPDSCFNSPYVLFNRDWLSIWHDDVSPMWGLQFLVVPSYNHDGVLNEIGFRILDTNAVDSAFKWLFANGQQATFGLQNCDTDKPLTLVEGAWDYMALNECGATNVVGLGSVFVTERHHAQLGSRVYRTCFDQDSFGIAQRAGPSSYCFFVPEGKDPFETYLQHGAVRLLDVKG